MTNDETKERCESCDYLIDDEVYEWYCEYFDMHCEDVKHCEEWNKNG